MVDMVVSAHVRATKQANDYLFPAPIYPQLHQVHDYYVTITTHH